MFLKIDRSFLVDFLVFSAEVLQQQQLCKRYYIHFKIIYVSLRFGIVDTMVSLGLSRVDDAVAAKHPVRFSFSDL